MVGNLLVDAVIIATVGSSILVEVDLAVLVLVAIAGQFVFNVDGFLVGFGQVLAGHIDDPVALVTLDGIPTELGDVLGQAVLGFANADTLAGQLSAGARLLVVDFQLHVTALAGLLGLQLGGQGAFNVVTTLEFLVEGTFDGLLIRDNLAVTAVGAILVHQLEVLRCIDLEFCRVLDGELLPVLDPVFGLPLGVEGGVIPHGQGLTFCAYAGVATKPLKKTATPATNAVAVLRIDTGLYICNSFPIFKRKHVFYRPSKSFGKSLTRHIGVNNNPKHS